MTSLISLLPKCQSNFKRVMLQDGTVVLVSNDTLAEAREILYTDRRKSSSPPPIGHSAWHFSVHPDGYKYPNLLNAMKFMLEAIPGIGLKNAKALLDAMITL